MAQAHAGCFARRDVEIKKDLMGALRGIRWDRIPQEIAWEVSALAPQFQFYVLQNAAVYSPRKILRKIRS